MTRCLQPHNAVTIFLMCVLHILYKALRHDLVSLFSTPTQRQPFCAPPISPINLLCEVCGVVWFLWDSLALIAQRLFRHKTFHKGHVLPMSWQLQPQGPLLRCGKTQFPRLTVLWESCRRSQDCTQEQVWLPTEEWYKAKLCFPTSGTC